ncbi:uncharacterized protein LOC135101640 isoform X2 [Scylla paramamosain]|uniref:uncharacterized protein LOC135101640 isoform X2 n=1 Tax=Scylla paramamosain TaxID=85552 RepID=UPI003082EE4B
MPLISRILAAGISIGLWLCSDTHVLGGSNTCYQLVRSRGFCWCSLSSDSLGRLCSETVPTSLITRKYCLSHPFFTNSMIQLICIASIVGGGLQGSDP